MKSMAQKNCNEESRMLRELSETIEDLKSYQDVSRLNGGLCKWNGILDARADSGQARTA